MLLQKCYNSYIFISELLDIFIVTFTTQNLENQRTSLYGIILIVMGIALLSLHFIVGGSNFRDFCSGVLLGLSIGEMLVGVYVVARGLSKQQ